VSNSVRHVVAQNFLLGPAQRRPHRRDLRDDVDTIALVFDHTVESAHLALDAVEPLERRRRRGIESKGP
jgi:hypothetical protein